MNIGSPYEKGTLKNRLRELATLASFTLSAALLSMVAMDLIALPLTLFAVNETQAFNKSIMVLIIVFASLITIYPLTRKILFLKRSGIDASGIILHLVKKIAHYLIITLMFLGVSALLIFILYLLLSNNHFLLSRALNIP
ncbi:MAG TPA: hypothetical protein PK573_15430 [Spirochaetota bacterium]|nr:hypothetical protein [Spirochaetota bacterium]HRZ25753.1 hypothetical protein [Spirochaetota bacterium]HSA13226.1 hypothetical protein [Spirochaetota bacterium]